MVSQVLTQSTVLPPQQPVADRTITPTSTTTPPLERAQSFLFRFSARQVVRGQGIPAHMANWLHFEKYANASLQPRRNNPLATYTEVNPLYRPNSEQVAHDMPVFELPREQCRIYTARGADPRILAIFLRANSCLFPVHPQVRNDANVLHVPAITTHPETTLPAVATASSRTVYIPGQEVDFFVKNHLPYQITRSVRHQEDRKIKHGIRISDDLAACEALRNHPWFSYLPESLGITFAPNGIQGQRDPSWGFVVREATPQPALPEGTRIVPLFALYCPDSKNPDELPVLQQMIDGTTMDPETYILERIFYPILQCWADVFQHTGVLLEAHAQNTCVAINKEGVPVKYVFRDFDTHVNREKREELRLSLDNLNPFEVFSIEEEAKELPGSHFSLIYDQAMRVPFDRIADLAEKVYEIPKERLQQKVREYLHRIFPDMSRYFPPGNTTYNYTPGALAVGAKAKLVDTGEAPLWR